MVVYSELVLGYLRRDIGMIRYTSNGIDMKTRSQKTMMIINLGGCNTLYEMDQDLDMVPYDATERIILYLITE